MRSLLLCAATAWAANPLAAQDTTQVVQEITGGRSAAAALDLPFRVALFPLRLLAHGLSNGLGWVEGAGVIAMVTTLPDRIRPASIRIGGLGEHSGAGGGIGVALGQRDVAAYGAGATANATTSGYQLHAAEVWYRLGPSLAATVDGQFRVNTRDEFYGVGNASAPGDRSDYDLRRLAGGVGLEWRPHDRVRVGGRAGWRRERAGGGGRNPTVANTELVFAASLPPAFDVSYRYLRPSMEVAWDGRRATPRGVLGAWVSTLYAYNRVVNAGTSVPDVRFHELGGEAHAYASLGGLRRILALRTWLEVRRAERGTIPFHRLAAIGGSRDLRAFPSTRFRDNDGLLLTAEYRYRVWEDERAANGLDMVLFVDQGAVAPNLFAGLRANDFHSGYGIGVRLTGKAVLGRVEVAHGREGTRLLVRAGPPF